jgi:SAM-dependent methyltransferase
MQKVFHNPNTSKLWDKLLFEPNEILLKSPFYIRKINSIAHFLKSHKGRFLNIGIGAGNLERKILKTRLPIKIFGTDISPLAIKNAKETLKGDFYLANISKQPFKASFFDVVAVLDVLEHIYEKDVPSALGEINRVMKNKGCLVVSVPLNENLKELSRSGRNYNRHLREYTLKILSNELKSAGFIITRCKYIYAFRKLFALKSFIIKLIPWFRKPNLLIVYCKKK